MKNIAVLFLLFFIFSAKPALAQDQESDSPKKMDPAVEALQHEIDEVKTEKSEAELRIKVNSKIEFVFPAMTNEEKFKEEFDKLSVDEQVKFHEVRSDTLAKAAVVLSYSKLFIGFGKLVGNSFTYIKSAVTGKERSFSKIETHQTIQNLLNSMDRQIWEQSHLFTRSGDMGIVLVAGLMAEGGVAKKGWGGILDFGISMGYDRNTKTAVFEIFKTTEKFKTALPSMLIVGLYGKAGFYVSEPHAKTRTRYSSSFYPPAFPAYAQSGADYFSAGASSGVGFPPLGLSDMLSYINEAERTTLLRLRFSPQLRGFVRLQVGLVPKFMKQAIYEVEKRIHKYKMQHRAPIVMCGDVL